MKGSCHCGAVRFECRGSVRRASICHCSQCRRLSGRDWASADVAKADLSIEGELRGLGASDRARRGFCPTCGAFLFWEPRDSDEITACHCIQCRKTSGHLPRFFDDPARLSRIEGRTVSFTSPGGAVRSFCPVCGTKVAFDGAAGLLSLHAGLFDRLAACTPDIHIFTAYGGDYYDQPEGAPAYPETGPD